MIVMWWTMSLRDNTRLREASVNWRSIFVR